MIFDSTNSVSYHNLLIYKSFVRHVATPSPSLSLIPQISSSIDPTYQTWFLRLENPRPR